LDAAEVLERSQEVPVIVEHVDEFDATAEVFPARNANATI
jgi:PII-like signaling protein